MRRLLDVTLTDSQDMDNETRPWPVSPPGDMMRVISRPRRMTGQLA